MRLAPVVAVCVAACAQAAPKPGAVASAPVPPARVATPVHAGCSRAAPAGCGSPAPSFEADVRPILGKRCFRCHTGDGQAAEEHDFSTTQRLLAARRTIVDEIAACAMPPTSPLEDAEADVILRWAACTPSTR